MLYGLDSNLHLVCENKEWREFAVANGGQALLDPEWQGDALAGFSGSEKLRWQGLYSALLNGRLDFHEENHVCPSPVERRKYRLRITARREPNGPTSLLHHFAWQDDSEFEKKAGSAGEKRSELAKAYQTSVLNHTVRAGSFRVAQCLAPLEDIGGDLLWHWERPDGTTDVVLADAMGHGAEAAGLAVLISSLLDDLAPGSGGVSDKVSALNRALFELRCDERREVAAFATGLYLRLHPRESRIQVCSFAHEGPIFSNCGRMVIPTGLPVGVLGEAEPWPELSLDLAQLGQRFLLCSDGLAEQFNAEGEMFGGERLEESFMRGRALPVPGLVTELMAKVEAFRGSALVKDDRTLLAVELAR